MVVRERRPDWVQRHHGKVMRLALLGFLAVVVTVFGTEGDVVAEHAVIALPAAVYSVVMFVTAGTFAALMARRNVVQTTSP